MTGGRTAPTPHQGARGLLTSTGRVTSRNVCSRPLRLPHSLQRVCVASVPLYSLLMRLSEGVSLRDRSSASKSSRFSSLTSCCTRCSLFVQPNESVSARVETAPADERCREANSRCSSMGILRGLTEAGLAGCEASAEEAAAAAATCCFLSSSSSASLLLRFATLRASPVSSLMRVRNSGSMKRPWISALR